MPIVVLMMNILQHKSASFFDPVVELLLLGDDLTMFCSGSISDLLRYIEQHIPNYTQRLSGDKIDERLWNVS